MKPMFRRKKEITAIRNEAAYTIKVGHDRYGNLIIKELRVSGDNLDEVINQMQDALRQFDRVKVEQVMEID